MSASYTPLAQRLMILVQEQVDAHGARPVPMKTIRDLTRTICKEWDEHHYYEFEEWFTKFEFEDGSHVVWGEEENE